MGKSQKSVHKVFAHFSAHFTCRTFRVLDFVMNALENGQLLTTYNTNIT